MDQDLEWRVKPFRTVGWGWGWEDEMSREKEGRSEAENGETCSPNDLHHYQHRVQITPANRIQGFSRKKQYIHQEE